MCFEKVRGEFDRDELGVRRADGRFVLAGIDQPPSSPFRDAIGGRTVGSETFTSPIKVFIDAAPVDLAVLAFGD